MHTIMRNTIKLTALLLLVVAMFASGFSPAYAAPCTPSITFDLWAKTGTATLYGTTSLPIWGYAATSGDPAALPGPALVVDEGACVGVTLHNVDLPEATALLFHGQNMIPDTTGVTAGSNFSYSFTASSPGTYLYEAGLLDGAQYQVAMGLYGMLVVRPGVAVNQAYGSAATAFDDEAMVVLSDIDPALNNSASPAAFDMRNYAPKYFLVNGKAYPGTAPISTLASHQVLLRYANAGLQAYSMSLLGLRQAAIAVDGSPFAYARTVVAETIAPGQTADMLLSVPATAADGTKYALFDGNLMLHNNKANNTTGGFGGMLVFLEVGTTPPPGGDVTGPAASALALSPNPTTGSVDVTINATISDVATGGSNIQAAEYYIDNTSGSATSMSGTFGGTTASVSGIIPATTLAGLSSGSHTIYVRGQDSAGNWGPFNHITLVLDKTGPTTSALSLSPNPGNGSVNVSLSASANDSASGGSNIAAGEYTIDGGAAQSMSISPSGAKVASLTATIPAATVNALSEGAHVVSVRSQDSLGNWGAAATINLIVDKTGPATSNILAVPNPTNGLIGFNSSAPVVRVTATLSDVRSNIAAGEGFIDTVGAYGTGIIFLPSDGQFNGLSENGYADIPLTTINALPVGNHILYVRGKDAAGNWGITSSIVILIDKAAPTFSSITLTPNPTNGAPTVTLTVNGAADTGGAGVAGGEYWFGTTNPAPGGGTQFSGTAASIPVSSLATGTYTVSARIRDAAGNWSTGTNGIRSATLTVWADAIFSNGFETGPRPWGWSSASTNSSGRLDVTTGAAMVGTYGLQAAGNNTNYVQYNFGTAAIPAAPTYDARFYFRPNGNTSSGKDIFSAATSSGFGTTLFRVRYRLSGTTPQVQIQVGTANTNTTWTNINGGTANNVIEVVWQAVGWGPNPGTLSLYVNGALAQTLTTTSNGSVAAVRLGSVTSTGNNTGMFFDAFVSKRQTSPLIGP